MSANYVGDCDCPCDECGVDTGKHCGKPPCDQAVISATVRTPQKVKDVCHVCGTKASYGYLGRYCAKCNVSRPSESTTPVETPKERELDAEIAETIYGWKLTHVGPDAHGQNECDILTPDGKFPKDFELPRIGKIGKAYMCPPYSSDWQTTIKLAKHIGLLTAVSSLTNPYDLAGACLIVWRIDHGLTGEKL